METRSMETLPFGKDGPLVTRVGLGGEGILRTFGETQGAIAVIQEAVAQGITYFDSARVYAGSEGYYGRYWPEHPEERAGIFQTSKSAERDRAGALSDLETTLSTTGVDHLDLWQIHDVRTEDDLGRIESPGGALEAFVDAKQSGKTRFIGVTAHENPDILERAVARWPVDSILMPINPAEGILGGFMDRVLPLARKKGLAVIGMKVLGGSNYIRPDLGITAEVLIRYALSQDVTTVVVGCSTPEHVRTLARIGTDFMPLTSTEQERLLEAFTPNTANLAYYRIW